MHGLEAGNVLFLHYNSRLCDTMTGDMHTPGSTDTLTEPCSDGNGQPATPIVHRHHVRHDIEGLRALAVLSVLINHAFPNVLPGDSRASIFSS